MIRLEFGTVFPRPNPFPGMSVRANVLSCLRLAGLPCGDSAEVLETSLRQAGLWAEVKKRLRAPAGALSSGQQQRLCIARALAAGPRVLLMDDPCSTLDRPSALRVEEVIREISAQVTVVLATRDVRMAARVSDHTAFFLAEPGRPARIVESGPARSVLVAPKDPRTATYIAGRSG